MSDQEKRTISVEEINEHYCTDTLVEALGIKITKINFDFIEGIMPVSNKTKQPFGAIHGGANCSLAETLANIGGNVILNDPARYVVSQNINTHHIKAVMRGHVRGVAKATHIGKKTHIWVIETFNSLDELTSTSTITMAIMNQR